MHKDIQTDFVQNEEDEGKTDRQGTQNTQTTQNTQNPTAVIAAGERAVRAYQHWQPHPHRPAWPHPCTQLLCAQRERGQREQQQSGSTGRRGQAQGPRQGQRQGSAAAARRRCGGGAGSAGAAAALLWKWRAELASAPAVCGRPTRFYTHAPKRQGQVGQGRAGTGHGSVGSVRLSAPAHADPEVQPQRALAEAGAVSLGHREALGLERIRVVPVIERPVARRLLQRPAAAPAARALQSRLAQRGLVQRFVAHQSSEPGVLSLSISAAARCDSGSQTTSLQNSSILALAMPAITSSSGRG